MNGTLHYSCCIIAAAGRGDGRLRGYSIVVAVIDVSFVVSAVR